MITVLAPIDLLLQRAERIHRHECGKHPEGMEEAVIEVIVPDGDDFAETGPIYAPWLLIQTRRLLLIAEEALPARIGETTLSYDDALGAITERKGRG